MSKFDTFVRMSYEERECLKSLKHRVDPAILVTIFVHWQRQVHRVGFFDYAANWVEANKNCARRIYTVDDCELLVEVFPFYGVRHIRDGCSDWCPGGV